jgi:hypothetical protein
MTAAEGRRRQAWRLFVGVENWHEERDRLVQLLEAIESGKITHVDEADLRELQAITPENLAELKERLAQLNARLGERDL